LDLCLVMVDNLAMSRLIDLHDGDLVLYILPVLRILPIFPVAVLL